MPEKFRVWWRDLDASVVYAGFVEPAAGRYQISNETYAQMRTGGRHYTGLPGQPWREGRQDASPARYRNDPLTWLRLLRGVTEARHAGEETLRGTPCRKVIPGKILREMRPANSQAAVSEEDDNPAEFTAWIEEHHVRQIQTDVFFSGNRSIGTRTLELWDFGVPVDSLDWTRFPGRPWPLGPPLPEARPASRTVL